MRIATIEIFTMLLLFVVPILVGIALVKYFIRYGIDYYLDQKEKRDAAGQAEPESQEK